MSPASLFSPQKKHRLPVSFLSSLVLGTCLLLNTNLAASAIISQDPFATFTDNGANPAPDIELKDRIGSEAFTQATIKPGKEGLANLEKMARDAIEKYPNSGLAYEVLGTALFYSGDMDEALVAFSKASQLEPEQAGPWIKLGIVQMELGKLVEAEASLLSALGIKANNRIANQRLGLLYEYQKKNNLAIEHLQKGLEGTGNNYLGVAPNLAQLLNKQRRYPEAIEKLAPRAPLTLASADVHVILAASYMGAGEYEKARERFTRAVELQPDNKEYQLGLAISQRRSNQLAAAAATLKQLASKYSDWTSVYLEQGDLALANDDVAQAEAAFATAVSKGTNAALIDYKIANYYIANKKPADAIKRLRSGMQKGVAQVRTYTLLAELERSQNNLDAGLDTLRAGIEKFPDNSLLQFRTGSELAAMRRYDESLPYFEKAIQLKPQNPDVLRAYSLVQTKLGKTKAAAETAGKLYSVRGEAIPEALFYATLLQQDKQLAEAAAIYQKVLAQDSGNLVALNNLATLHAEQGKLDAAEKTARQAHGLAKNNPQIMDTLGWILYQQRKYSEALVILLNAADLAPEAAVIHYHTGVVYEASGNTKAAKKVFEKALSLDTNSYWVKDARQRLAAIP
ncbi:tetratricopeptide repeat protein [Cellvibrio sp. pealriver]|uniref:tetratricopeptide repeat protein n=1 Tax=Cellvibrio sp. pealriver TaxID=1622269 RepID=UPI00066FB8D4|nr:tetratricopeptide repeat protein [Cellvibrio sp. pealriver]